MALSASKIAKQNMGNMLSRKERSGTLSNNNDDEADGMRGRRQLGK